MPTTVDEGFKLFHSSLTPTPMESDAAKRHRQSIKECLSSSYGVIEFFRTGSFGKGTSIRGLSDIDYFAVIERGDLNKNSKHALTKLRKVLTDRFPSTDVSVRSPGVLVPFGKGGCETTEIIPAYQRSMVAGRVTYGIPSYGGGWIRSCPDLHGEYLRNINDMLDGKVKPLIRFVKAWAFYNAVPIRSFYLEMRVAKYASEKTTIIYSRDLKNILSRLRDCTLASIRDPTGLMGPISACNSETMYQKSLSKLNSAAIRAEKAVAYERKGDIKNAYHYWDLLFNEHFPAY
jgi:hypothetical protein